MMISGNWRAGVVGGAFREGTVGEARPADSVYDLASMTKVICTSTLLAQEWLESGVSWANFLNGQVEPFIPEIQSSWFGSAVIGELWEHRSGLAAHKNCFNPPRRAPFQGETRGHLWTSVLDAILCEPQGGPRGQTIYSDLGMLLLGLYLERKNETDLASQWNEWKKSHGLPAEILSFGVPASDAARFARTIPTEIRHPAGEVNDDKAASMQGIAPHAGLFGSCAEVWAWAEALVKWIEVEPQLKEWTTPQTPFFEGGPSARFHGGWDRPLNSAESQGGHPTPPHTIGHLGYTGAAIWWQPETRRAAVLLTNRVHPEHSAESQAEVKKTRQRFFSEFWQGKLIL